MKINELPSVKMRKIKQFVFSNSYETDIGSPDIITLNTTQYETVRIKKTL